MSVTYTAGWLTLWRGLFYTTFCHPYCLWLIPFLLLPLPLLIWLGSDFLTATEIIGTWASFWIGFLLFAVAGSAIMQTRKPCTTTIAESGLRDESWPRQTIIKWSAIIDISCTQDSIFLFRKGFFAATFVPMTAFTDPSEAQCFCETATGYWRGAKGLPATPVPDTARVWPPAPRSSNSAEPGDGREG